MNKVLDHLKSIKPSRDDIIALSDASALSRVGEFISTQCPPLDLIMGGGVPVGRMMEIYGDTSTGKTLVAEHILAETQAMGGIAAMLDTEVAIDYGVAECVGIDIDNLIYSNPETVEEVFDVIVDLVDAKREADPEGLMTIVWDSVAASSSNEEMEKVKKEGLGARTVATHARLISKMCRVAKQLIARERIALVMLNQTRALIGVMFGPNKSTFGGRAIGYYSSVRLELALRSKIKSKGDVVGIVVRAFVAKNKIAPPFGKCNIPILFDIGVDEAGSVLEWLKDRKVAVTRGSWSYLTLLGGNELRFQGIGWPQMYNDNREAVLDLMFGVEEE